MSLSLLILFYTTLAGAESPDANLEKFKQISAQEFAKEIEYEYHRFKSDGAIKDAYGFFIPPKVRPVFEKSLDSDFTIKAVDTKLVIQRSGKTLIEMDALGLIEERFTINGKAYAHDWNGDPIVLRNNIKAIIQRQNSPTASFMDHFQDAFLPKAHAVLPAAVAACVEGACEILYVVAQRGAMWVASNSGTIRGALQTVASSGARARVVEAGARATKAVGTAMETAYLELRTNPALHKGLAWTKRKVAAVGSSTRHTLWVAMVAMFTNQMDTSKLKEASDFGQRWFTFNQAGATYDEFTRCTDKGFATPKMCPFIKNRISDGAPYVTLTYDITPTTNCPNKENPVLVQVQESSSGDAVMLVGRYEVEGDYFRLKSATRVLSFDKKSKVKAVDITNYRFDPEQETVSHGDSDYSFPTFTELARLPRPDLSPDQFEAEIKSGSAFRDSWIVDKAGGEMLPVRYPHSTKEGITSEKVNLASKKINLTKEEVEKLRRESDYNDLRYVHQTLNIINLGCKAGVSKHAMYKAEHEENASRPAEATK